MAPDVALRSLRALRRFPTVKEIDEIHGKQGRVYEHALCAHRMRAHTVDRDLCRACVECFIDDLTEGAAVNGIGVVDGELCKVHIFRAPEPALLVGDKGDIDIAVPERRITRKRCECRHDVGDCGLVVCAEDTRAVGDDQLLPNIGGELWVLCRPHNDVFLCVQHDVVARVGDALRLDHRAERNINGVQMSTKSDRGDTRRIGWQIGGQMRRQHAFVAPRYLLHAEGFQLLLQEVRHIPLLLCARHDLAAIRLAL